MKEKALYLGVLLVKCTFFATLCDTQIAEILRQSLRVTSAPAPADPRETLCRFSWARA